MGLAEFNPVAAEAVTWTAAHLSDDERAYLNGLPLTAEEEGFTLVHGSLRDPVWEYLLSADAAAAHLDRQRTPYGLVGHSHIPFVFEEARGRPLMEPVVDGATIELGPTRFVANPGGFGQPRDGDPRAAYAVLDTADGSLTFHRVEYDIALTQARMEEAGLPAFLSERLGRGR
jgi:diadenosine tetraphosphatase ApaH/serine/threonine PP2A family protein phosphatase